MSTSRDGTTRPSTPLQLPTEQINALADNSVRILNGVFLQTLGRAARAAGFDAKTALKLVVRIFPRVYRGGAIGVELTDVNQGVINLRRRLAPARRLLPLRQQCVREERDPPDERRRPRDRRHARRRQAHLPLPRALVDLARGQLVVNDVSSLRSWDRSGTTRPCRRCRSSHPDSSPGTAGGTPRHRSTAAPLRSRW